MTPFLGEIFSESGKRNPTTCFHLECRIAASRIHMGQPGKSAANLRLDDCEYALDNLHNVEAWRTEIQPYGLTRLANMSVRSVMPSRDGLIGRAIRAKEKVWKFDLCSLWLSCGAAWHAEPKCHAPIHGYLGCVTSKHPREQVQEKDSCAAAFLSNGSFVLFNLLGSLLQTACLGWWSCSDLSSLSSKSSLPARASIHVKRDLPCKHRRQNLQWRREISKMTMADMWMARSDDAAVGLLARRLVTAIKIHSVMRPKVT
jgi:hypothetical protein